MAPKDEAPPVETALTETRSHLAALADENSLQTMDTSALSFMDADFSEIGTDDIRISADRVDRLMNLASELVLGRNQLRREMEQIIVKNPHLGRVLQNVDKVTSEIQEDIMHMRMQPLGRLFDRLPRLVREFCRRFEIQVDLSIEGKEVTVDRSILEGLADPLGRLVLFRLGHMGPSPAESDSVSSAAASLGIQALHEGGQINILVTDNGAVPQSGAVEMEAVKSMIEGLGGQFETERQSQITLTRIRLPLTLMIIPSLIVGAAGNRFAIPQVNVRELVRVMGSDIDRRIETIGDSKVLRLRERLLPLVDLARVLAAAAPPGQSEQAGQNRDINIVVLKVGPHAYGLIVGELFDNEEIVVKPLSDHLRDCKCFAGATIMGDGRVSMILDAGGIAQFCSLNFAEIDREARRRRIEAEQRELRERDQRQAILIFNLDETEQFALPLDRILRLEKIERRRIHAVGNRRYLNYRGKGLPLIFLDEFLPVSQLSLDAPELHVIIPKSHGARAGIVVSRILDTRELDVQLDTDSDLPRGLSGSAFLDGTLTLFLDPDVILAMALPGGNGGQGLTPEAYVEAAGGNSLELKPDQVIAVSETDLMDL